MKLYIIKEGRHYSNFVPSFFKVEPIKNLSFTAAFHPSCEYHIDEPSCVNKLFGFCFGFGVHRNSVRYGWTYDKVNHNIAIWSYVYKKGKLHKEIIGHVDFWAAHEYDILMYKDDINDVYKIQLLVDGVTQGKPQEISSKWPFLTTLGPYFGGKSRAPHTMHITNLRYKL
jgi:hypothetical protein